MEERGNALNIFCLHSKGLIMVPRSRNARTSREHVLVLSGFSEQSHHSSCCCVALMQGYNFWEAHIRPLRT